MPKVGSSFRLLEKLVMSECGLDGRKTYVTLECNALIHGKGKDDITAGFEGVDEDVEVLLLGDPGFLGAC